MLVYVASSNPGKLRDFNWAAAQLPNEIRLEPLPNLKDILAPPENEPTFEANARAKALYYAREAARRDPAFAGQLILADDSGLELRCLNGAPGVRSARYAEDMGFPHPPTSTLDERNNAALLRALDCTPEPSRDARYRCSLALARNSEIVATADGTLDGVILTAPRGDSGFGYDPLFLIPETGKTMAEIDTDLRLQFSHRGRALRNLLNRFTP